MAYNWQLTDWPNFHYDLSGYERILLKIFEMQGRLMGMNQALSPRLQQQSLIDIVVSEALSTSSIEGEFLSRPDVLSSVRNNLGLTHQPEKIQDPRIIGVTRLMLEVRETFDKPLTEKILYNWHKSLMEGYPRIRIGQWRKGPEPMQIISGPVGKEIVHFEAPPASYIPQEMKRFISWFNETASPASFHYLAGPVRAAIAHLYFESIHPFEDGNGRIGRAISEKALSQGFGAPVLLSLSHVIHTKRSAYYKAFQDSQRSLDISSWIHYFLGIIEEAQRWSINQIGFTIQKTHFFDTYGEALNPRQEKVLNRMFDAGPEGFDGGMRTKKYISITKTSKATATRDLQELVKLGALWPKGSGRSKHYEINFSQ